MAIIVGALGVLVIFPAVVRILEWDFIAMGLMLGTGVSARRRLTELEDLEDNEWFVRNQGQSTKGADSK